MKLNKLLIYELLHSMLCQSELYCTQTLQDMKKMNADYEMIIKKHIGKQLYLEYKELRDETEGEIYKQGFMEGIKFLNYIIENFDKFISEE